MVTPGSNHFVPFQLWGIEYSTRLLFVCVRLIVILYIPSTNSTANHVDNVSAQFCLLVTDVRYTYETAISIPRRILIIWRCRISLNSLSVLRVQNEQFSEEKGFILRYTEKEV